MKAIGRFGTLWSVLSGFLIAIVLIGLYPGVSIKADNVGKVAISFTTFATKTGVPTNPSQLSYAVVPMELQPSDEHVRDVLLAQGIDPNYTTLINDYSVASPYSRKYKDIRTDKYVLETQELPQVDHLGAKIITRWIDVGSYYITATNVFVATVDKATGTTNITVRNNQPDGRLIGQSVTLRPELRLGNKLQPYPIPVLLGIDPINSNYISNTIEWDYGFCKRRLRIIEGRILGTWVFPMKPSNTVSIKYNQSGNFRLRLGQFRINDDEEQIDSAGFDRASVPLGYPVVISDSSTFYPDAHIESTSVDGYCYDESATSNGEAWDTIYNNAGDTAGDDGTRLFIFLGSGATTDYWRRIYRNAILFDTSGLDDAASISAATLSIRGEGKSDDLSITPSANIYSSNPASNTAVVGTDYAIARWGATEFSTTITYADWVAADWNDFALNASGLAAISKIGISKFGFRNANYDAADIAPSWSYPATWWSQIYTYSSDQGEGFKPKLVVTYSVDVLTNSPTANTGAAWTNPQNAYANDSNYAYITAGNPSGSNVWGTYGFSFTSENITQVRVRYDAWSVGSIQSQTIRPDGSGGDPDSNTVAATSTGANFWSVVDEVSANDTDYYTMVTNAGGRLTVTAPAATIPTGSTIQNVTIYYRGNNGGTASFRPSLKIGATYYDATGTVQDPSAWTTYNDVYTTNPKTGVAWVVSDVNRVGGDSANYLNAFGTASTDCNPDNTISWLYIVINYTEYNDQIKVDVSWDGGSSWSATQDTTLTSTEVTTWYDVTSATSWNATKLSDGQLQVRALAQLVNNAEQVRLDWIPVEVTYSSLEPSISVSPTSYNFGIVSEGSTYSTNTSYFVVDNTSTIQTDQTISVTTTTWSGGNGWGHNDSGIPGANATAIKANRGGTWGVGDVVVKNDAPNYIYENCPGTTDYSFGLELLTPTVFYEGSEKTITVRITAVSG